MYGPVIHKAEGYDANEYTYYPVVIVGAGISGIAMGCQLKEQLGFDQFRIFDRQSGLGGTWWINRYPGVACDVPAVFYSFSFCPNPTWSSLYPSGLEIVKYLQGVCEQYKIVDKIQLNTDIKEARWDESEGIWKITLQHLAIGAGELSNYDRKQKIKKAGAEVCIGEEEIRCKVFISGAGGLVEPKTWPEDIPGNDKFEGTIFHSARWRYDIDLKDKDVVVLGTGCSAAQFVPRLIKEAKSVTQIMRSPPWVVPKVKQSRKWKEWSVWLNTHIPGFQRGFRALIFAGSESEWRLFGSADYNKRAREKYENKLRTHLKRSVPEKYHEILAPNYAVGCKRRIFDAEWFPSLHEKNMELTTLPLTVVNEKSVTLGPGRTYDDGNGNISKAPSDETIIPADVIILANGFEVTEWLHPLEIVGRGGTNLHQVFDERGGPQLYMGSAMDGFPNFFVIFGPNTATGHSSVVLASENMVNMIIKLVKPILSGDVEQAEVKKQAELDWSSDIQRALKSTVWHMGGCRSWYKTDTDWNSTVYPYSQIWFTLRCMFPTYSDWDIKYTAKGLRKNRAKAILRYIAYTLMLVGVSQLARRRITVTRLLSLLKNYLPGTAKYKQ